MRSRLYIWCVELVLLVVLTRWTDATNCSTTALKTKTGENSAITPKLDKFSVAFLMILGFGGFAVVLALVHKAIRRYVFHDADNLDTVFDAGGRVSMSLTAVTVTSQMLWPADFLQGATTSLRTGLSGPLFYGTGVILTIILFPILSLFLKTRAPGAKTFLQIVYARFGKAAHIVFCCVALFVNVLILTFLTLAGKAALEVLSKNSSYEFIALILAVLFGSYCFIGGLGTTFYISYFNTALIMITVVVFAINVSFTNKADANIYATHERIYEAMTCIKGPDGNHENSLMTFRSRSGIIIGIIMFLFTTSLNFCDQANWQSRVAAKPSQGVVGFFIAAYLWFGIPTSVSMMSAMTYVSMSFQNHTNLLSDAEIDSGYITPFMMESIMGTTGAYLLITMITMALMSTGSGEVMAISSIIVYDIYKTYINPFRKLNTRTSCYLCGNEKVQRICGPSKNNEKCECPSADNCVSCEKDKAMTNSRNRWTANYTCAVHGSYRHYEDLLLRHKTWCIVWVTIAIIPYALIILSSGVDLNWAFFTLQTLLSPFSAPLLFTIAWSKSTAKGVISGVVIGLIATVAGILIVAQTVYEGGLSNFMENTVADYSLLGGTLSGLVVSTLVTVGVSLKTNNIRSHDDTVLEWQKTLAIDNPLHSWKTLYKEELSDISDTRNITANDMDKVFRRSRFAAYIGGAFNIAVFIVFIPSGVLSMGVLTFEQFNAWVTFCQVVTMVGAVFAVLVPPAQEIVQIYKEVKQSRYTGISKLEQRNGCKTSTTKM